MHFFLSLHSWDVGASKCIKSKWLVSSSLRVTGHSKCKLFFEVIQDGSGPCGPALIVYHRGEVNLLSKITFVL